MMTSSETKQLIVDLMEELLPKTKARDRKEFAAALVVELTEHGLEIEEDFEDDESFHDSDLSDLEEL